MRGKKLLSLGLAVLFCLTPVSALAAYGDTGGHWAEAEIQIWSDRNILLGNGGRFRPDEPITRGEMAIILDRVMGYQAKANNSFADLDDSFYTDAILRANEAGVILGSGGKVRPRDDISRQEAAVMLCRALRIDESSNPSSFTDGSRIDAWAAGYVSALAARGFINGRPNGAFDPHASISRAEVVKILDDALQGFYYIAGEYSEDITGIAVVNRSGVTLKEMTIHGDLILADGIGDGEVTLDNVTVTGKTVVRGGGVNSVNVTGASDLGDVYLEKIFGDVSVKVSGGRVGSVTVIDGTVYLSGVFDTLEICGGTIILVNATVTDLSVTGSDVDVTIDGDSKVTNLTVTSQDDEITNNGAIANLHVNGDGLTFDGNKPGKITIDSSLSDPPTNSDGTLLDGTPDSGGTTGGGTPSSPSYSYYTVTFEANGGSNVSSQSIRSGNTASRPANPTKTGHIFAGWYKDEGLITAFDFSTPITGPVVLYAEWKEIIVTGNAKGVVATATATSNGDINITVSGVIGYPQNVFHPSIENDFINILTGSAGAYQPDPTVDTVNGAFTALRFEWVDVMEVLGVGGPVDLVQKNEALRLYEDLDGRISKVAGVWTKTSVIDDFSDLPSTDTFNFLLINGENVTLTITAGDVACTVTITNNLTIGECNASGYAKLATLAADSASISFGASTYEYSLTSTDEPSLTLTASADAGSEIDTVTVNGSQVTAPTPGEYEIDLAYGANVINILVAGTAGLGDSVYTITVERTDPLITRVWDRNSVKNSVYYDGDGFGKTGGDQFAYDSHASADNVTKVKLAPANGGVVPWYQNGGDPTNMIGLDVRVPDHFDKIAGRKVSYSNDGINWTLDDTTLGQGWNGIGSWIAGSVLTDGRLGANGVAYLYPRPQLGKYCKAEYAWGDGTGTYRNLTETIIVDMSDAGFSRVIGELGGVTLEEGAFYTITSGDVTEYVTADGTPTAALENIQPLNADGQTLKGALGKTYTVRKSSLYASNIKAVMFGDDGPDYPVLYHFGADGLEEAVPTPGGALIPAVDGVVTLAPTGGADELQIAIYLSLPSAMLGGTGAGNGGLQWTFFKNGAANGGSYGVYQYTAAEWLKYGSDDTRPLGDADELALYYYDTADPTRPFAGDYRDGRHELNVGKEPGVTRVFVFEGANGELLALTLKIMAT